MRILMAMSHPTEADLVASLEFIREAPLDDGTVEVIVRRPRIGERESLEVAEVTPLYGLVGDSWRARGSSRTPDRSAIPEMQLAIMSARVIDRIAGARERWPLAGDQLYVDLDLSLTALPPGTRLALGSAEIEITAKPHTGCRKFADRFGVDALKWVSSEVGRELRLRGVYAKVVRAGTIRVGDKVRRLGCEGPVPPAAPESRGRP